MSAVLLQPADLLKTRVQQTGHSSLRNTIREILDGPRALSTLWRGTVPSALRTGIGSAIYFGGLNVLRQRVAHSKLLRPVGVADRDGRSVHSSTLPKLSNFANLMTGAVARASAGFVLMPMTVIKVRYESNFYAYRSMLGAIKDILRNEGIHGFFAGVGATALRDAPYAGLYLLFYEGSKKRLSLLTQRADRDKRSSYMKGSTSVSINFASGILGAGLATALTNPFDAIKTRIQLQPKDYQNILHAGKKMVREDGFRSLFDGLGLRMSRKALSSALAWTLYEELIRRADLAWKQRLDAQRAF